MLKLEQLERRDMLTAVWADIVLDYQPGRGVSEPWNNPEQALGAENDRSHPGTYVALGEGGSIEIGFSQPIRNGRRGSDFAIFEKGAPDSARLSVSDDMGETWTFCSTIKHSGGIMLELCNIPITSMPFFNAIRLVDDGSSNDYTNAHAGFDLNAVRGYEVWEGFAAGDANEDGFFDIADIGQVALANKYDRDVPTTWAEGDWNGDGRFNRLDLVLALQGDWLGSRWSTVTTRPDLTT